MWCSLFVEHSRRSNRDRQYSDRQKFPKHWKHWRILVCSRFPFSSLESNVSDKCVLFRRLCVCVCVVQMFTCVTCKFSNHVRSISCANRKYDTNNAYGNSKPNHWNRQFWLWTKIATTLMTIGFIFIHFKWIYKVLIAQEIFYLLFIYSKCSTFYIHMHVIHRVLSAMASTTPKSLF